MQFTLLQGNKLIINITIAEKRISLVNTYGPNRYSPSFYEQISQYPQDSTNDFIILTGDFSLVMDTEKDTETYFNINNSKAKKKVLNLCEELNFIEAVGNLI